MDMEIYKNAKLKITPTNIKPFYHKSIECGDDSFIAEQKAESIRVILSYQLSNNFKDISAKGYKIGECRVEGLRGYSWFLGYSYWKLPNGTPNKIENWVGVRYKYQY